MDKTIFCFDIDGTLLTFDHRILDSTIETIQNIQSQGHKAVIATGRNYGSVKRTGLLDKIKWDAYVLNNGQCVLDENFQPIHEETLDQKTIEKIIEVSNREGWTCCLETVFYWFTIQEPSEYTIETHRFFNEVCPQKQEYDPSMKIIMAMAYAPKGYDYAPYKEIEGLTVDPGFSAYADLTKKGCHKYTGIEKCMEYLKCTKSVCFGDGSNDIDMITLADVGVAMGNAIEELKEVSDMITDTNEKDGIYHAIQKLGYL